MHRISCPIKDVSAADLGVRWNGPLPEVLAEETVIHNSYRLHLGVIGASHVVTVTSVSAPDQPLFREEISCTARSKGQPLPTYAELPGYRLQSAISTTPRSAARQNTSQRSIHWWFNSLVRAIFTLRLLAALRPRTGWNGRRIMCIRRKTLL